MVNLAYQYYWLQNITGHRELLWPRLLVTEKTNGSSEQQEKWWSTLKQIFIVSREGSAIIQMTMGICSTLQAAGPGQESVKRELCHPHRTDILFLIFCVLKQAVQLINRSGCQGTEGERLKYQLALNHSWS